MKSLKLGATAPLQLKSQNVSPRASPNLVKQSFRTQFQSPKTSKPSKVAPLKKRRTIGIKNKPAIKVVAAP
jgi:hypothetical protein